MKGNFKYIVLGTVIFLAVLLGAAVAMSKIGISRGEVQKALQAPQQTDSGSPDAATTAPTPASTEDAGQSQQPDGSVEVKN